MRSMRLRTGAALCGLSFCAALAAVGEVSADAGLRELSGPARALLPSIARYFSTLNLKLAEGSTARALARALQDDEDDGARAPLLAVERAGALANVEALPSGSTGASRPLDDALRASTDADDGALYGAGLGLGVRLSPDSSVSASYHVRKPYTGQDDINYLKMNPGAAKEDISLDFRFRF